MLMAFVHNLFSNNKKCCGVVVAKCLHFAWEFDIFPWWKKSYLVFVRACFHPVAASRAAVPPLLATHPPLLRARGGSKDGGIKAESRRVGGIFRGRKLVDVKLSFWSDFFNLSSSVGRTGGGTPIRSRFGWQFSLFWGKYILIISIWYFKCEEDIFIFYRSSSCRFNDCHINVLIKRKMVPIQCCFSVPEKW